jgi:hypothetical protein
VGVDLLDDGLIRFPDAAVGADNRALDEWARDSVAAGHELPQTRKVQRAHGPCALCKERPAHHRCVHCERGACKEDYWIMLGLCRDCVTEAEVAAAKEPRSRPRPDLGIKWVEE